jgi:glucose/arabinose dehydrogenase
MFSRALRVGLAAGAVLAGSAVVADAAGGPAPPPPTSTNGNSAQLVASGLMTPTSFAFGGGAVFEGDGGSETAKVPNGGVYVLKNGTATKIAGSPLFVGGLAWHHGSLFVSGATIGKTGIEFQIDKWSGWNGTTFKTQKAIYTAPKKFDGFNGLGFGANGRLYVGVDVGLTNGNDHGPAKGTPYLYDILTMNTSGKGLKVFAKGIRQPWQMTFPKGSNSPYVTALGQDKGAKNPPDFILRVKAGDNFGFPKCNHTVAKACRKYAKPFEQFKPHTDLMGIALSGKKLYLSSFTGGGKGPGGKVFTLSSKGGKLKPLLTGFVAPVVGLGLSGHWLYVGELSGDVYRLKV